MNTLPGSMSPTETAALLSFLLDVALGVFEPRPLSTIDSATERVNVGRAEPVELTDLVRDGWIIMQMGRPAPGRADAAEVVVRVASKGLDFLREHRREDAVSAAILGGRAGR